MANSGGFTRTHLIYAIVLPLAIFVGFLLADPMDTGAMAVLVLVLSVLATPILMRWHHPLLVFSCNALICLAFIPGTPSMWMLMAAIGMAFLVLNRCLGHQVPFFQARSVAFSLICLAVVVLFTAYFAGGVGFGIFGGTSIGGRKYLTLFLAIALYFAISSQTIPTDKAGLYMGLYTLSGFTALAGFVALFAGPAFYTIFLQFFPIQGTVESLQIVGNIDGEVVRWGESGGVAGAVYGFIVSRYGLQGTLNPRKPWRFALLAASFVAAMISGFRSVLIGLFLLFVVQFCLEGLFRKALLFKLGLATVLAAAIILPNARRLPQGMQRALAFLPIEVDPVVRMSADASTQWRLDMWEELLPQIPRHLIKGKGYGMDADDVYMASVNSNLGYDLGSAASSASGDYHSGPISVILPFGIAGTAAFIWFLVASLKALRQNYLYGDPAIKSYNTFLFAFFIVRIINFIFIFGSLYSDLAFFAAIIAMSVSLNGGVRNAPEESAVQTEEEEEFLSTGNVLS